MPLLGYTSADLYGSSTRFTPGEFALPSQTPGGQATGVGNGTDRAGTAGTRRTDKGLGTTNNNKDKDKDKIQVSQRPAALDAETLRYPLSEGSSGHYLRFKIYDYAGAEALKINDIRSGLTKGKVTGGGLVDFIGKVFGEESQGLTPTSSSNPSKNAALWSIYLYVPPKLEYSYGATWNKVSFGALGAAIGQGGLDLSSTFGATAAAAANTFTSDVLEKLSGIPKAENLSLDAFIGGAFGVTFNDNTLQTFDRMSTRSFNFDYMMLARNAREEDQIKQIILKFKWAMHPGARKDSNNVSVGLDYPYIFKIEPADGRNLQFIPSTKYCALTKMSVDYTPNSVFNPTVGSFVHAVRLSLGFDELTTLTRADLETGAY